MKLTQQVLLIIIGTIVLGGYMLLLKNTTNIQNIEYFSFSFSEGMAINDNAYYRIECEEERCMKIIKPVGEEKETKKGITRQEIEKLEELLKKYQVASWNHFNKYDKNVLDGNSFSLSIRTSTGKTYSATGYMKWPKNYREVKQAIQDYFES